MTTTQLKTFLTKTLIQLFIGFVLLAIPFMLGEITGNIFEFAYTIKFEILFIVSLFTVYNFVSVKFKRERSAFE